MGNSMRSTMLTLAVLVAALACIRSARASSLLKSQQSNPVLPVVVNGQRKNLILTTDMDGILLCADPPDPAMGMPNRIDYDYARKLLRYQLSGMIQEFAVVDFEIPSFDLELQLPVGVFYLNQQVLSPAALTYFLHQANASGFVGLGYAFRPSYSPFWNLLETTKQYRYSSSSATGNNFAANKTSVAVADFVAGQDESQQTEWDWSEPSASVDQADDLSRSNNQGLVFPVHHTHFQCTSTFPSTDADETPRSQRVDMFGGFTSYWDAAIDFNSPCLVLPQQFYDSLAGWVSLSYNETARLSMVPRGSPLPSLLFSLTHDGPVQSLDLNTLRLPHNTTTASSNDWVCIQRSGSIVHTGASVFSSIDTAPPASSSAVQHNYRLHSSMVLPVFNMQQTPLVFGTMVLHSMRELLVDGETKQIAFPHPSMAMDNNRTNVINTGTTGPVVCRALPSCIGHQLLDVALNACLDPDCTRYYFQFLDPATKQCVVSPNWLTFLYTTVAVLVAAELLISRYTSRTIHSVITTTPAT